MKRKNRNECYSFRFGWASWIRNVCFQHILLFLKMPQTRISTASLLLSVLKIICSKINILKNSWIIRGWISFNISFNWLKKSLYNPSEICYIAVRTFSPTTLEIVCGRLETVGRFLCKKKKEPDCSDSSSTCFFVIFWF